MRIAARLALAAASVAGFVSLAAGAALADRLELTDGRVVEGTVTKDGETYRVLSRFGESEIAAGDVKTWTKAKSIDAEWRERLAALKPGDHAGRAGLAKWLQEVGRTEEASAMGAAVLEDDPENAVAHDVLGHIRHKGEWMTPEAAKRADGLEEHGEEWYTPDEWKLVDGAKRAAAEGADQAAAGRRLQKDVNEAVRLMLSPDKDMRVVGERRLQRIADETKSESVRKLITDVKAFADATDRMSDSIAGGVGTALTECRIQMARLKRPIKTFSTSLASGPIGTNTPVTIQMPEMELIKLMTTVPIPAAVK